MTKFTTTTNSAFSSLLKKSSNGLVYSSSTKLMPTRNISWKWNKPPPTAVQKLEKLSLSYYSYKPEYLMEKEEVQPKPPIIALHGLYTSKAYFYDLAASLAMRLRRQVFLLDLRNHGESPWNGSTLNSSSGVRQQFDGKASLAMLSHDLVHFMDEFAIPKALLLGYGLGGRAVIQCAQLNEPRIEKLITVDISQDGPNSGGGGDSASLTYVRLVMKEILRGQVKSPVILKFLLDGIRLDSQSGQYVWRFNARVLEQMLAQWSTVKQIAYCGRQSKAVKVLNVVTRNNFITSEDYLELRKAYRSCAVEQVVGSGARLSVPGSSRGGGGGNNNNKPTLAKAIEKFAAAP
ncbi:hypothetical protein TYRP_018451 [Tyrophagus putrescentiae]|nr:hypothetical protein TYRP_018451 [Tyrophagus putrescentiae]